MHCKACDKQLSDKELSWNEDLKDWELCTTCLDVALDAAYCDGFHTEDDEYVIIDDNFGYGDAGDILSHSFVGEYDD